MTLFDFESMPEHTNIFILRMTESYPRASGHIKQVRTSKRQTFLSKIINSSYEDADGSLASVPHIKGQMEGTRKPLWLTVSHIAK